MSNGHHHHNHEQGHSHGHHTVSEFGMAFTIGLIINVAFVAIEVFFGFRANSSALLADAGHNLSDVMALLISWIAIKLSQQKPNHRYTYGLGRTTILAALFNTMLLLVAIIFIGWEAVHKLSRPTLINGQMVSWVAFTGVLINGFTAWLFLKGRNHDINIRSTFLHFVADALVSMGVVVAGIVILYTGWWWVDPMMTFIIVAIIFYGSYHLLIDSVNLSIDAVPEHIDLAKIREYLLKNIEVKDIHGLHVWPLSTTETALTVHVVTNVITDDAFIARINAHLHDKFGIEHSTIQIETCSMNGNCGCNCN